MKKSLLYPIIFTLSVVSTTFAGEADVLNVKVTKSGERTYQFEATVLHADTGWEHYADKWDILDENGNILDTRILHHPHVDERPFTRGLSGVEIPQRIKKITIRAHDSVHEYGGKMVSVHLP
jgi:hypothetical protein